MPSRPASDPLDLGVVDALAQLAFLVHGTLEARAEGRDISMAQVRLLGVLRDRRPTMNELARLLGLDKSSVTGLVDRAERRGLVAREPSETDRRAVRVALTRRGRAIVNQVSREFEAQVRRYLQPLSDRETATLSRLVSRLLVAQADERGVDLVAAE